MSVGQIKEEVCYSNRTESYICSPNVDSKFGSTDILYASASHVQLKVLGFRIRVSGRA